MDADDIMIRPIRPEDDRREISRIYAAAWRQAYRGIVPQEYLDRLSDDRWAGSLDIPGRQNLLCLAGERIVGTSAVSRSRSAERPDDGEIISIYFLPGFQGRGYGKRLISEAAETLRRQGYQRIFLWVLEENAPARAFYERMGYRPTGESLPIIIDGKELRELRYEKYLK